MRKTILIALVALALWIGVDLYRPVHTDLCSFDAAEVARLETAMGRSYYDEPADRFVEHARARAKAERLTSSDWNHIEQLLEVSWNSLNSVL